MKALKKSTMVVRGMGISVVDLTASGLPAADSPVIRKLAGNAPGKGEYGLAYDHFKALGQEQEGIEMCLALDHWLKIKGVETLLSTYIQPLQEAPDQSKRIHCSMNLNTETGRLSCRKPNL
jgi:DNA polymerase I